MKEILIVGAGGCCGSILRYKIGALFLHHLAADLIGGRFPWATFIVNVVGCLLVGIAAGLIERFGAYNTEMRLLIITGFLGGFTTFSAFGLETVALYRGGSSYLALVNVLGSLLLGLLAVWCGLKLGSS